AKQIHAEGLQADALLVRGGALTIAANTDEAVKALDEATWLAMRSRRDDLVAQSSLALAIAIAEQKGQSDLAEVWLKLSSAAAQRIGIDRVLELRRLEAQGVIDGQRGDVKSGVEAEEKALVAATAAFGADSPALWEPEELVAAAMGRAGGWV